MNGAFSIGSSTELQNARASDEERENPMIRNLFVLMAMIAAVPAAAALQSAPQGLEVLQSAGANQTVIYKNSPFPVIGPLVFEACAVEDCSDVPQ